MEGLLYSDLIIQSGGQTGADRAALDWAIENGLRHRGWCPRGRVTEDGQLPQRYELLETESFRYAARTQMNVEGSDGTAILSIRPHLTGGSLLTRRLAQEARCPWLHLHPEMKNPGQLLRQFVKDNKIEILNMAGPRASTEPNVYDFVKCVLNAAFS